MNHHQSHSRIFGLVGHPLGHSFSKDFFNRKFANEGVDALYVNFDLPSIENIRRLAADYPALTGFNVTIPYKRCIMPMLDSIHQAAAKIGAVNTVRVSRRSDGSAFFEGFNTDADAFGSSIAPLLGSHTGNALILGTGGAALAVRYALQRLGIDATLVSRSAADGVLTYSQLTPEVINRHLIIVNATPVGMYPHTDCAPGIPYGLISPRHLCFDLTYNPAVTKFMHCCAARGATVKNGLEMLTLQALAAWRLWNE